MDVLAPPARGTNAVVDFLPEAAARSLPAWFHRLLVDVHHVPSTQLHTSALHNDTDGAGIDTLPANQRAGVIGMRVDAEGSPVFFHEGLYDHELRLVDQSTDDLVQQLMDLDTSWIGQGEHSSLDWNPAPRHLARRVRYRWPMPLWNPLPSDFLYADRPTASLTTVGTPSRSVSVFAE